MSHAYYYFAASLPMIHFDQKPGITMEEFRDRCGRLLSAADDARIKSALEGASPSGTPGVLGQWLTFEFQLRNESAFLRAQNLKKDPAEHTRGARAAPAGLTEALTAALKMASPLDTQKAVDRLRWQFLDEIQQNHYFDFEFILIYGLKLQILERYALYQSGRGEEKFEELEKFEIKEEHFV